MTSLKRDSRNVSDFSKLELLAAGDIHLIQGDSYSVEIEAEDTILDYLTTEVRDGVLLLDVEDGRSFRTEFRIRYFITAPKIELVRISGSGHLHLPYLKGASFLLDIPGSAHVDAGTIEVNAFTLDVKGSGKLQLGEVKAQGVSFDIKGTVHLTIPSLTTEALTQKIEGTATINLAGESTAQIINSPGVINYQAQNLQSSHVNLNAQGMANLTLWVKDILTVRLQGVGNIRYYGNPERHVKINGMGNVQRLGDTPELVSIV